MTAATVLQEAGLKCAVIAEGLSLHEAPRAPFRGAGGTVLTGEKVKGGIFDDSRLCGVYTQRLGGLLLQADEFILATGKFFSRGLVADMDGIREPLFGLDVEYDEDRSTWTDPSFAASQRFLGFGLKTRDGLALKGGIAIENLRPVGEILSGVDITVPGAEKLIRKSALDAAQAIINKR